MKIWLIVVVTALRAAIRATTSRSITDWAGERAVRDEQLVAVVTFLGDPTVAQAQYLDASP